MWGKVGLLTTADSNVLDQVSGLGDV